MHVFSKAFLVFIFAHGVASQFTSETGAPEIGESIFLKCRLNAPENQRFVDITPELRVNSGTAFTCGDLSVITGISRYEAMHKPDNESRNLNCDVFIFFLQESDFGMALTCSQKLENQTVLQYHYTLTQGDSNTQTTSPWTTTYPPIKSPGITTYPQTTLPTETCNVSLITRETRTDNVVLIVICSVTLILVFFMAVGLGGLIILFLYKGMCNRRSQDLHPPEIPKSKKQADNVKLQDNTVEPQESSTRATAQEEMSDILTQHNN